MIKVTDKYSIDVDSMNYTIRDTSKTWVDKKTGEKTVPAVAYCTTLESALSKIRALMKTDVLIDKDITLDEAIRLVREENRRFEGLLSRLDT